MILIVDMTSDPLWRYEFVDSIGRLLENYDIKHYAEDLALDRYSHVILSGSSLNDVDYAKHLSKFSWIRNSRKPILGICAGMQAIGLVFGSKLRKCREIGMTKITTAGRNPLFSGAFDAYELHNYSADPPKGFRILARSGKCIQAFGKGSIYGVLFHPEVRNGEIIKKFCSIPIKRL